MHHDLPRMLLMLKAHHNLPRVLLVLHEQAGPADAALVALCPAGRRGSVLTSAS